MSPIEEITTQNWLDKKVKEIMVDDQNSELKARKEKVNKWCISGFQGKYNVIPSSKRPISCLCHSWSEV